MSSPAIERKRKFWRKMIWISAMSLVLSICAGVVAYLIGMIRAFGKLGAAEASDPAELANDISTAVTGPVIAIPFVIASLILFIIAIFRHRKFSNPTEIT